VAFRAHKGMNPRFAEPLAGGPCGYESGNENRFGTEPRRRRRAHRHELRRVHARG
jgi:hypothetical protein